MFRKRICSLALAALLLLLCGCRDSRAASSQILALNIGLDAGESYAIRLTVQLPEVSGAGSGGSSESGSAGSSASGQADPELIQSGYVLTQVEGDSITECLTILAASLPREVTFLHIRGLYFSDAFARSGYLFNALAALLRSGQVRTGAPAYLCLGRAEDILKAQSPALGTRLSKSHDSRLKELQMLSVVPDARLIGLYSRMLGRGSDALAVLTAINGKNSISTPSCGGRQPADHLAGELPYNSINPVSYFGSAVFRGTELALFLSGYETQLMNMCLGRFEQGALEVPDASAMRSIALQQPKAPSISVRLDGDAPLIAVDLILEGSAPTDSTLNDVQLLTQRVQSRLQNDVVDLLLRLQQAGCDPLDFEGHARMKALTNRQWQETEWDLAYPKASFLVNVRFTLRTNAASVS